MSGKLTSPFQLGDRVVCPNGDVGHIEEFDSDDGLCRVRLLTPHNTPSCCSSWVEPSRLSDGTNIRPMPKSKRWYAEAAAFMGGIIAALTPKTQQSRMEAGMSETSKLGEGTD